MVKGDMEPIAVKKFENFREYLTIYPEFRCIFIGDNGQGDVRAAEIVLNDERYRNNLQRVYIHEIQPLNLTYAKKDITKSRDYDPICYFNTYIDAAIDAHHHQLIRATGLRRIMEAALRDFEYIPLSSWLSKTSDEKRLFSEESNRDKRVRELNGAISRGNRVLSLDGFGSVRKLKFTARFAIGTPVVRTFLTCRQTEEKMIFLAFLTP